MWNIKNRFIQRIIWITLILAVWEFTYHLNVYNKQLFPSIIHIISALLEELLKGNLINQVVYSIFIIFKGLSIGFMAALTFSFIAYISKVFNSFLDTIIAIFHPLPGIALLPLVILWFGIGERTVTLIIIHSVIWPIIINIKTGFFNIDKAYIDTAHNNGINYLQLFYYVLIPLSFSYIISGLKIGWSRSWRALISSEMIIGAIGSFGGLGWYLLEKRAFMDTTGMYSGLIVIIIIGIIMEDIGFAFIDKKIHKVFDI